jgi:altronate dehydratase small subunit
MAKRSDVIVINEKDNVATALKSLQVGVEVPVELHGTVRKITILSEIPMGHKFALKDLEEGDPVIKYGEAIGQSSTRIVQGEHVHVHNVVSRPKGSLSC